MFDVKLNGKNEISISIKNDIDIDNLTRQFIDFDLVLNPIEASTDLMGQILGAVAPKHEDKKKYESQVASETD